MDPEQIPTVSNRKFFGYLLYNVILRNGFVVQHKSIIRDDAGRSSMHAPESRINK